MFGSFRTKFQPSLARYLPLSGNNYDSSPQTGAEDETYPEVEKIYENKPLPSLKSRLFYVLLGTLVVAFVVGIIIDTLGLTNANHLNTEGWPHSGMAIKQFAPPFSTRTVVFSEKIELMEPPNDESTKAWDSLIPNHGFIKIPDGKAYDLMPGISIASGEEVYGASMFHQLHCLTALRNSYWRLMDAMSANWTDAARQEERHSQLRDEHMQHCFVYIAESIWCSGDLTIEWAKVEPDGRTHITGWGVPHQCKDPEAIRVWMQENQGSVKDAHARFHN